MAQCTAIKRDGSQCRMNAIHGTTKCKFHGGKSLRGVASPRFKDGRYSKFLPKGLVAKYEQATSDPELLNLRDNIAVMDIRLGDLLESVKHSKGGASNWSQIKKISRSIRASLEHEKIEEALDLVAKLDLVARDGIDQAHTWSEIGVVMETRRRLTESEQKRLVAMNQTITAENAMMLVHALASIVKRHVKDRDALALISEELIQITGRRGDPVPVLAEAEHAVTVDA